MAASDAWALSGYEVLGPFFEKVLVVGIDRKTAMKLNLPQSVIGLLRTGAEIIGIPGKKVDALKPNATMTAAEEKRQRKMAKRAGTFDKR